MSHHSGEESDEDCYGPQYPPNFLPSTSSSTLEVSKEVIGPSLPPGFRKRNSSSSSNEGDDTSYDERAGASLYPTVRDDQVPDEFSREYDDDEDVIGPVLPSAGQEIDRKRGYLDSSYGQSIRSKNDVSEQESKDMRREEWMTVVPKNVVKKMGFKSVTSFCKKPVCNDDVDDDDQNEDDVSKVRQGSITDPSSSTTKMSIEKEEKVRQAYEDYTKNKRSLLDQHRESLNKVCIFLIH